MEPDSRISSNSRSHPEEVPMRRFAVAILPLAFVVACGGGKSAGPSASGSSPERAQIGGIDAIVRGRLTVSGSSAEIAVKDNFFVPNVLTAPAGTTLTMNLTNQGAGLHNFSVAEQGIDHDVPPSSSAGVKVTVPASGRLVFFCKYHRAESGMVGALDVA